MASMISQEKLHDESKKRSWTDEEILDYWEHPDTEQLIIDAEPMLGIMNPATVYGINDPTMVSPTETKTGFKQDSLLTEKLLLVRQITHDGGAASKPSPEQDLPPSAPKLVESSMLARHPYHSVGKLFWFYPWDDTRSLSRPRQIMTWVTAFYIGDDQIMTCAHAFDQEDVQNKEAVFVPAMIDAGDTQGEHFGHYRVYPTSRTCHPDYI